MGRGQEVRERYSCFSGAFFLAPALAALLCQVSSVGSVSARDSHLEVLGRIVLRKEKSCGLRDLAPWTSPSNLTIGHQNLFWDLLEARCPGRFTAEGFCP